MHIIVAKYRYHGTTAPATQAASYPDIKNELLLLLPTKPARDISLGLCRLLLNSPIHLVNLVAGVLAESIELILAILG
jgi:hypothetical protein